MASQITDLTIIYLTVYSGADPRNIKAPRHWPLCGEFTGDRWIPRTNGQLRGKCFHFMTSSWCWEERRLLCTIRLIWSMLMPTHPGALESGKKHVIAHYARNVYLCFFMWKDLNSQFHSLLRNGKIVNTCIPGIQFNVEAVTKQRRISAKDGLWISIMQIFIRVIEETKRLNYNQVGNYIRKEDRQQWKWSQVTDQHKVTGSLQSIWCTNMRALRVKSDR